MGLKRISGTSDADRLIGSASDEEIRAGGGDDEAFGGSGDDRLRGGRGNDFLDGGEGNDRLRGDHGDDVLVGGAGRDRFIFNLQGGDDVVRDYVDETDRLDFTNFNFATADDLLATARQSGADVVFDLPTGVSVTLQGVALSSLEATDFLI